MSPSASKVLDTVSCDMPLEEASGAPSFDKVALRSVPTLEQGQQQSVSDPPPLPYDLRFHKLSIFLNWHLIFITSSVVPLVLYYVFYSTLFVEDLRPVIFFAITISVCGILSPIRYFFGVLQLIVKGSKYRPIGSRGCKLDYFHCTFAVAYVLYLSELIICARFNEPPLFVLALPCPTVVLTMGFSIFIPQLLYTLKRPNLFRVSSVDKGQPARPGVYAFIEDVTAVEGFGGLVYRRALNERYEASPDFRRMLSRLSWFWIVGCLFCLAKCAIAIVYWWRSLGRSDNTDTHKWFMLYAYTFAWLYPFIWGVTWALITIVCTKAMLRREKVNWFLSNGMVGSRG